MAGDGSPKVGFRCDGIDCNIPICGLILRVYVVCERSENCKRVPHHCNKLHRDLLPVLLAHGVDKYVGGIPVWHIHGKFKWGFSNWDGVLACNDPGQKMCVGNCDGCINIASLAMDERVLGAKYRSEICFTCHAWLPDRIVEQSAG